MAETFCDPRMVALVESDPVGAADAVAEALTDNPYRLLALGAMYGGMAERCPTEAEAWLDPLAEVLKRFLPE